MTEWQGRPLDDCYPLVFFDAIRVKVRDEGFVRNKAVYIALGILPDGTKEILGIWIEQTEGAKFWMRVMNELKNRGVADILIAVVDGLKGFPDAINAVFPQTIVQTCIVHLIRNSMSFASWKDRKAIAQSLRSVYRAEKAKLREGRCAASRVNDVWAMDFVHDQLATGPKLRVLTVVDTFSRYSPAVVPRFRFRALDVIDVLERVCAEIGYPASIRVDQGSEFISRDLDLWASAAHGPP